METFNTSILCKRVLYCSRTRILALSKFSSRLIQQCKETFEIINKTLSSRTNVFHEKYSYIKHCVIDDSLDLVNNSIILATLEPTLTGTYLLAGGVGTRCSFLVQFLSLKDKSSFLNSWPMHMSDTDLLRSAHAVILLFLQGLKLNSVGYSGQTNNL